MSDNALSDEYSEEFKRREELDFLDRAALAAMKSIIARDTTRCGDAVAKMAYDQAEAMLVERTKWRANRAS